MVISYWKLGNIPASYVSWSQRVGILGIRPRIGHSGCPLFFASIWKNQPLAVLWDVSCNRSYCCPNVINILLKHVLFLFFAAFVNISTASIPVVEDCLFSPKFSGETKSPQLSKRETAPAHHTFCRIFFFKKTFARCQVTPLYSERANVCLGVQIWQAKKRKNMPKLHGKPWVGRGLVETFHSTR